MLDCDRCHRRMGNDNLPTIWTPGRKISATRVFAVAYLQGVDILGRD